MAARSAFKRAVALPVSGMLLRSGACGKERRECSSQFIMLSSVKSLIRTRNKQDTFCPPVIFAKLVRTHEVWVRGLGEAVVYPHIN